MRIPRKSGSVKNKLQRIAVHAELVNADNPSRAHHALLRDMPGVQPLERVMGIEPTRPAWKAGVLPLNYTRAFCDGNYYSTPLLFRQGLFQTFLAKIPKHKKERAASFPCQRVPEGTPALQGPLYSTFNFKSCPSMVKPTPETAPSPCSTKIMASLSSTMRRMLLRRSRAPLWPWMDFSAR